MTARPWPSTAVVQEALDLALARQTALTETIKPGRRRKRAVTAEEARNPAAIKGRLLRGRAYKVRWDWWWILAESGRYSINGIATRVGIHHATLLNALNKMAGGKRSWRSGPAPGRYASVMVDCSMRAIAVRMVEYAPMEATR